MRRLLRKRAVAATLFAAAAALLAGCGGGGDSGTVSSATAATSASAGTGNADAGAAVWEQANCGSCHTLAAAGSDGSVGPNLDDLKPDFTTVVTQVTNGGGGMPAFGDQLTEQQIADVSAYVVRSTGG